MPQQLRIGPEALQGPFADVLMNPNQGPQTQSRNGGFSGYEGAAGNIFGLAGKLLEGFSHGKRMKFLDQENEKQRTFEQTQALVNAKLADPNLTPEFKTKLESEFGKIIAGQVHEVAAQGKKDAGPMKGIFHAVTGVLDSLTGPLPKGQKFGVPELHTFNSMMAMEAAKPENQTTARTNTAVDESTKLLSGVASELKQKLGRDPYAQEVMQHPLVMQANARLLKDAPEVRAGVLQPFVQGFQSAPAPGSREALLEEERREMHGIPPAAMPPGPPDMSAVPNPSVAAQQPGPPTAAAQPQAGPPTMGAAAPTNAPAAATSALPPGAPAPTAVATPAQINRAVLLGRVSQPLAMRIVTGAGKNQAQELAQVVYIRDPNPAVTGYYRAGTMERITDQGSVRPYQEPRTKNGFAKVSQDKDGSITGVKGAWYHAVIDQDTAEATPVKLADGKVSLAPPPFSARSGSGGALTAQIRDLQSQMRSIDAEYKATDSKYSSLEARRTSELTSLMARTKIPPGDQGHLDPAAAEEVKAAFLESLENEKRQLEVTKAGLVQRRQTLEQMLPMYHGVQTAIDNERGQREEQGAHGDEDAARVQRIQGEVQRFRRQ